MKFLRGAGHFRSEADGAVPGAPFPGVDMIHHHTAAGRLPFDDLECPTGAIELARPHRRHETFVWVIDPMGLEADATVALVFRQLHGVAVFARTRVNDRNGEGRLHRWLRPYRQYEMRLPE